MIFNFITDMRDTKYIKFNQDLYTVRARKTHTEKDNKFTLELFHRDVYDMVLINIDFNEKTIWLNADLLVDHKRNSLKEDFDTTIS